MISADTSSTSRRILGYGCSQVRALPNKTNTNDYVKAVEGMTTEKTLISTEGVDIRCTGVPRGVCSANATGASRMNEDRRAPTVRAAPSHGRNDSHDSVSAQ